MGDAILVRVQRLRAWSDIRGRHHMQEILVGHERCQKEDQYGQSTKIAVALLTLVRQFEGIIQRLRDFREVGSKRELRDDMRQVHH